MKKTWIVVCACCLFVSAAGFAQNAEPSPAEPRSTDRDPGSRRGPQHLRDATEPGAVRRQGAAGPRGQVPLLGDGQLRVRHRHLPGQQQHHQLFGHQPRLPGRAGARHLRRRHHLVPYGVLLRYRHPEGETMLPVRAVGRLHGLLPLRRRHHRPVRHAVRLSRIHRCAPLRQAARRAGLRFFPPATALYCVPPCTSNPRRPRRSDVCGAALG